MSERTRDIETLFRPGGIVPVDIETTADLVREVLRLRAALDAACGFLTNAAIDLETGAPKRTALATINGGLKTIRAALGAQS